MHSTDGHTEGITFHHNGDYSGEVIIEISDDATWEYKRNPAVIHTTSNAKWEDSDYWTIRIPFEDLKLLVSDWVRSHKISKLEDASDDDILLEKN